MTDKLAPERRSANMRAIRSKNMKPERIVRKLVHGMGFRYRLHRKDLPGKPDLVFGPKRKVVFVHGCFWHMHPDPLCRDARLPKSNMSYWGPKLARNVERDLLAQENLIHEKWEILVIWECEVRDPGALKEKILGFLSGANGDGPPEY